MSNSLKKQYASKLASKLIGLSMSLITVGLIPRTLGPEGFGNFNFLTAFFAKTIQFLSFGSSTAYYTKISGRKGEKRLMGFYAYYTLILVAIVFLGVTAFLAADLGSLVWPGQKTAFIYAAALFAVLSFIANVVRQTADSFGLTIRNEVAFTVQTFLGLGLTLALFWTGSLDIRNYFLMNFFLLGFLILAGMWLLYRSKSIRLDRYRLSKPEISGYLKEFYQYSHPLFAYSLVLYFANIADRWLLQTYYGAVEQGFYSLAFKISSVVYVFTSAVSPLFLREVAKSHGKKDKGEIRRFFEKYLPILIFVSALISLFICFNARAICAIVGGEDYGKAEMAVAIMAFYPILQTYAQFNGSVFLGTDQTKSVRNIGLFTTIMGIGLSFLLMVPTKFWAFRLGATGLSWKMVIMAWFSVNIQLWFIAKYLGFPFMKYFLHQAVLIVSLGAACALSKYSLSGLSGNLLVDTGSGGLMYVALAGMLVLIFPALVGMKRGELKTLFVFK